MDKGEAAQAVEVSAYPDRYRNYEPVAEQILQALTTNTGTQPAGGGGAVSGPVPDTSRVVFPMPESTWVMTSPYGMREHPITGEYKLHSGTDFAGPDSTPILAAADGVVTVAEYSGGYGGLVIIEHTVDGKTVATAYAHSWETGIHVTVGDRVTAGQHIADVGSSGQSTGPHVHFEVRLGGTNGEFTDPAVWLDQHGAANLPAPDGSSGGNCATGTNPDAPNPVDGDPDQLVDDPTTSGQITRRMLNVYQQTLAAFPDTSWSCYSPRPGQKSEHPLGRACDVTFGNAIGSRPTPAQLEAGWQVTNWLKDNAETLGEYSPHWGPSVVGLGAGALNVR